MTDYRFPTRIEKLSKLQEPALKWTSPPRELGMIGNRQAGSFAEYKAALALYHLNLEFIYKYNVQYTSYVVDFYINNGIEWIPLDVNNYRGPMTSAQRYRVKIIESALGKAMHTIYDIDLPTFEAALVQIRALI